MIDSYAIVVAPSADDKAAQWKITSCPPLPPDRWLEKDDSAATHYWLSSMEFVNMRFAVGHVDCLGAYI